MKRTTDRLLADLLALPGIDRSRAAEYERVLEAYPFSVTPFYAGLMAGHDPLDPIRLQCVPDLREIDLADGGCDDPFREEERSLAPGLVQRFDDRVLAVLTSRCAVLCRHCTRKRIWRAGRGERTAAELEAMAAAIAGRPGVREVLVSGGDPLLVSHGKLDRFLRRLRRIPHVEVLRIGTRLPVVLPMAVTDDVSRMLARHRPLYVNTQFNHPREVTGEAAAACERLLVRGIPVSNQAVLLKGVNDSADVLLALFHALQRIAVRPYCLYHCDPVRGATHFRTTLGRGLDLMEELRRRTSPFCLPEYVLDTPDRGKVTVTRELAARIDAPA